MDDAFACPDCGTFVQIKGLAPGRQVRCGFCHRLLEVPYFPRVAETGWKRRRFQRPWWVAWAWSMLGLLGLLIAVIAAAQFVGRHERDRLARSIDQLIDAAQVHEKAGNADQAVVDLDTAIQLCPQTSAEQSERILDLRSRRQNVARRGAQEVLERLGQDPNQEFPLGDWLNLEARVAADPDLAALRGEVAAAFRGRIRRSVEADLAVARTAAEQGNAGTAFDRCEALTRLAAHLPEPDHGRFHGEAGEIVHRLVERHGLILDPPSGRFIAGSLSRYNSDMVPTLVKMLKEKSYLPQPDRSTWKDCWSRTPFRFSLQINEQLEGNYMASENRLTRIDAHLKLFRSGAEIWNTTPTARTKVPLPNLPGYYSARVALSTARIDEFERLLYDSARSQIDEKFAFALSHMPECRLAGAMGHP